MEFVRHPSVLWLLLHLAAHAGAASTIARPARAQSQLREPVDDLLAWLAAAILSQAGLTLLLGAIGWFTLPALNTANLGILAALAVASSCGQRPWAVIAGRCARAWRRMCTLPAAERLLAACLVGLMAAVAYRTLILDPRGYDTYYYHLPELLRWIEYGDFRVAAAMRETDVGYYFFGWHLVLAPYLLTTNSTRLACLPNIGALLLLALAMIRLVRAMGLNRFAALVGVALFAGGVAPLFYLHTYYSGIALTGSLLAALTLLTEKEEMRSRERIGVGFGMLGFAIGAKPLGLLMALPLLAAAVILRRRGGAAAPWDSRAARLRSAAATAIGVCLAVAWPLRNYLATGNPLGFLEIEFLGRTIFPGFIEREWLTASSIASNFGEIVRFPLGDVARQIVRHHGAVVPLLLVFGALGARKLLRRERREKLSRRHLLTYSCLALAWMAVYLSLPHGARHPDGSTSPHWVVRNLRFCFPAVALLSILAASGADRLPHTRRRAASILIAIMVFGDLALAFAKEAVPLGALLSAPGLALVAIPLTLGLVVSIYVYRTKTRAGSQVLAPKKEPGQETARPPSGRS